MSSSSSSAPAPRKITIVVAPVQLVVIETDEAAYQEQLENVAKSFLCPVHTLFSAGLVKVFEGREVPVELKGPEIRVAL